VTSAISRTIYNEKIAAAIRAPNRATVDDSVFALLDASVGAAEGEGVEYVEVVVLF
jgi:hypothetical protein